MQCCVVLGEKPLVCRDADDQAAAGSEYANHFGYGRGIGLYVLEYIRCDDHIESSGAEGKLDTISSAVPGPTSGVGKTHRYRVGLHPDSGSQFSITDCVPPGAAAEVQDVQGTGSRRSEGPEKCQQQAPAASKPPMLQFGQVHGLIFGRKH